MKKIKWVRVKKRAVTEWVVWWRWNCVSGGTG